MSDRTVLSQDTSASLSFAGNSLDRVAPKRTNEHWLEQQIHHKNARFIAFCDGQVVLFSDSAFTSMAHLKENSIRLEELLFLGVDRSDSDRPYFAVSADPDLISRRG
ncbi:hypothetical protein [Flexibacterium corallicola]|uniref:hypothetical protein n=1 Tax=Flexibacterium corallicola TaxID=3037259 RepID=UPI00286EFD59|nr:hypothetical protein [Pseudovibrio sp. M1P-2-3]